MNHSSYLTAANAAHPLHSCALVCLHLPPDLWQITSDPDIDLPPLSHLLLPYMRVDDHLFPADFEGPHPVGLRKAAL